MNRYQSANSTLSFAVLAASVAGISKWTDGDLWDHSPRLSYPSRRKRVPGPREFSGPALFHLNHS
jgi:hypothetical protein